MTDLSSIRAQVIGEGHAFVTPYGVRRMTYVDHAASGRSYLPIEQFICKNVLPTYGNTHTETTLVGAQTTAFREEARRILREATGCTDEDACIFTGNGVTGAIQTLLRCMGLTKSCVSEQCAPDLLAPVVFVGSYEHHSNDLPWRESVCEVEVVAECDTDGIDLNDLERLLQKHRGRKLIGSFSAASNVTGRLTNVSEVARCLHNHGAVAFFDYAAAAPYVSISMQGGLDYADAIFLSMHKFTGGPGSPGVLLAKKRLFVNRVPSTPGGGTVSSVGPHHHDYLADIEHREEGGTPNIIGSIRAGLAMKLKQSVGADVILAHEQDFARRFIEALSSEPGVVVLGNTTAPRLGTISFLIEAGKKALHHNFVVALLNDLFGIQARGGNSCAAPYAHKLLGVGPQDEVVIEACVRAGWHGCKPGWSRVSFGWYDSEDTLAFVAAAIRFIARYGSHYLSDYTFDPATGSWCHRVWERHLLTLESAVTDNSVLPEEVRWNYIKQALKQPPLAPGELVPTPFEALRWFWLPGEIL